VACSKIVGYQMDHDSRRGQGYRRSSTCPTTKASLHGEPMAAVMAESIILADYPGKIASWHPFLCQHSRLPIVWLNMGHLSEVVSHMSIIIRAAGLHSNLIVVHHIAHTQSLTVFSAQRSALVHHSNPVRQCPLWPVIGSPKVSVAYCGVAHLFCFVVTLRI